MPALFYERAEFRGALHDIEARQVPRVRLKESGVHLLPALSQKTHR